MTTTTPTIVVMAHDRPGCLLTLLASVAGARCPAGAPLIISIDGEGSNEVAEIAEAFEWHGPKKVVRHQQAMGLKTHLFWSAGLTTRVGPLVLLEDDLIASAGFFDFAQTMLDHYRNESSIAGISLYGPEFDESSRLPFQPLTDDHDVYFTRQAMSWGVVWTPEHWAGFRDWYERNGDAGLTGCPGMPAGIAAWPETSWKKHFQHYMLREQKLFVAPRLSLVTNPGVPGHHTRTHYPQISTQLAFDRSRFVAASPVDAPLIYDAFLQLDQQIFKQHNAQLEEFDFEVDLFASKNPRQYQHEWVLTTRECRRSEMSFATDIYPIEMNVIQDLPGNGIHLCHRSQLIPTEASHKRTQRRLLKYLYRLPDRLMI